MASERAELLSSFQIAAVSLPAIPDPSVIIAAMKAGAVGILDAEYIRDSSTIFEAAKSISRSGAASGIKLCGFAVELVSAVSSELSGDTSLVILTWNRPDQMKSCIDLLHARGMIAMLEVTSLEQAEAAIQLGADGLVVKGNEAGGFVGEKTSFVLLQQVISRSPLPVWVHGGVGLHSAAACYVAGARGVILDSQLALTVESRLPEVVRKRIQHMDGTEPVCSGGHSLYFRMYHRPGFQFDQKLVELEKSSEGQPEETLQARSAWHEFIHNNVSWDDHPQSVWLLGQDVAFANNLARQYRTVGGIVQAIRKSVNEHVEIARDKNILGRNSPLALSHGTVFPIVQGPMARVSDNAAFASAVSDAGGLPFIALSKLSGEKAAALLSDVSTVMGSRPWGIGILGFNEAHMFQSQIKAIDGHRPAFAILAGGMPVQAQLLESKGLRTYVHMQSVALLEMFIEQGLRRFIFEGRECGGHIGPRSSFVLWDRMIQTLLALFRKAQLKPEEFHILFAGGIHDALSAAMTASMTAPLAEQGVRTGVVMGSAYLLTEEVVKTGAVVSTFQSNVLGCKETHILETSPGHAIRCCRTPFVKYFEDRKDLMSREKMPPGQLRSVLEGLVIGRLRIASKGTARKPSGQSAPEGQEFISLSDEQQLREGIYMVGQLASLRKTTCSISDLHRDVSEGAAALLETVRPLDQTKTSESGHMTSDVAIIGMACLFPKAGDLQTYWENILNKVNAISEIPSDRWDWKLYFDEDRRAKDKIYCRWGGFLDDIPFDPLKYGIPPSSLKSIEPLHLMTLEVVSAALRDAGYEDRDFPRENTSVIIGTGEGIGDIGQKYILRSTLPTIFEINNDDVMNRFNEWTEDSFAGIIMNVSAGRVANRFNLGGINYTIDAACASSLAALYEAFNELKTGSSDMVITGGIDAGQSPFTFTCFSKTNALSPTGKCSVFDEKADGTVISEGLAFLVLKRREDAERDGDRIYAIIKSVAGSSDGRNRSLTAPNPEGQCLAMQRAYSRAGFTPDTVELFEAHGTGTVVGDRVEAESVTTILKKFKTPQQNSAIGSVKSMIGHTKGAAGIAGLIKAALALYYRVLPPTLGVEKPNASIDFNEGPIYVNSEMRPWVSTNQHPRRAGISAFGFGGTNFHAVLEQYPSETVTEEKTAVMNNWPSELLWWTAKSREEIVSSVTALKKEIDSGWRPRLADLAFTLFQMGKEQSLPASQLPCRLGIIADSLEDLVKKLAMVQEKLQGEGPADISDDGGIYFTERGTASPGEIAFLFPGQGSQYPDMMKDAAIFFPEVLESFERANVALKDRFPRGLSRFIFPAPAFNNEKKKEEARQLSRTDIAQPSIGAACCGMMNLLEKMNIRPAMTAGHSYGEYVALSAAGVFDEKTLYRISESRGRFIIEASEGNDLGTMAAVRAGEQELVDALKESEGVVIANINSPVQTVISGSNEAISRVVDSLKAKGMSAQAIPVSAAFHSPAVEPAKTRLSDFLRSVDFHAPRVQVFSNTTAAPYESTPDAIRNCLSDHMINPVKFVPEIEAMYEEGARIFIEVGPGSVLTSLTKQILSGADILAVATDTKGQNGITQLLKVLARLSMHGVDVSFDRLFQGRAVQRVDLSGAKDKAEKKHSPTTWMVSGSRAIPAERKLVERTRKVPLATYRLRDRRQNGNRYEDREEAASADTAVPVPEKTSKRAITERKGMKDKQVPKSAKQPKQADTAEVDAVMLQFQKLMGRFLDIQKEVMTAYLNGQSADMMREPAEELTQPLDETENHENISPPESADAVDTYAREPVQPEHIQSSGGGKGRDRQHIRAELLRVTSEHTGYPQEMLDSGLDMEAELGIDSIKRVEILNAFTKTFSGGTRETVQGIVDELSRLKTLDAVMEKTADVLFAADDRRDASSVKERDRTAGAKSDASGDEVPRYVLKPVKTSLPQETLAIPRGGVFLITDDGSGLSELLSKEIAARGGRTVIFTMSDSEMKRESDHYFLNLTDALQIESAVREMKQSHDPIVGLIHLLPLSAAPAADHQHMNADVWHHLMNINARCLFSLTRLLGKELRESGSRGASWVIAATALQHQGPEGSPSQGFAGQGGIAGLLKTLAIEWNDVTCRAIDLDMSSEKSVLTEHILREMAGKQGPVEVRYHGTERIIYKAVRAPLNCSGDGELRIDADWVILVTGGAMGITAEVVNELAVRHRPTFVIVGRSPFPEGSEEQDTASLTFAKEIKSVIIEKFRAEGSQCTPASVDAAYSRLMKNREMRKNISALKEAGSAVHYFQADVRNEGEFGGVIERIYQEYGRIDGVIHGAGIIEDKLLEDKNLESFDRVFGTKVDGAYVLLKKIQFDRLKFIAFFTSVAGSFGNRGQSDYAAANEVLNKIAVYLDGRFSGRSVAVNWGPWKKLGMVTPELEKKFNDLGIQLVPPSVGASLFDQEIRFGKKGDGEVVIGDGPWKI